MGSEEAAPIAPLGSPRKTDELQLTKTVEVAKPGTSHRRSEQLQDPQPPEPCQHGQAPIGDRGAAESEDAQGGARSEQLESTVGDRGVPQLEHLKVGEGSDVHHARIAHARARQIEDAEANHAGQVAKIGVGHPSARRVQRVQATAPERAKTREVGPIFDAQADATLTVRVRSEEHTSELQSLV